MSGSMASFEEIKNKEEADNMFKIFVLATAVLAGFGFPWHDLMLALRDAGVPFGGHPPLP